MASSRASSPAALARPSASAAATRTLGSVSWSACVSVIVPRRSGSPESTSIASFRPSASRVPKASIAVGSTSGPMAIIASTAAFRSPMFTLSPSARRSAPSTGSRGSIAWATAVASLRTRQSASPSAFRRSGAASGP